MELKFGKKYKVIDQLCGKVYYEGYFLRQNGSAYYFIPSLSATPNKAFGYSRHYCNFEEIMEPQPAVASQPPRSIEKILAIRRGINGGRLSDEDCMTAQKFYNDLIKQLSQCPDLRGVRMVAIMHEMEFRNACYARNLPVS